MSDGSRAADPRPRPEYGEYATPEEQRARIAQPDATYALDTGQAIGAAPGAAAPRTTSSGVAAPPVPHAPRPGPTDTGALEPARRRIDRIVTLALLGYGLVNVIFTIVQLQDFPAFAQQFMTVAGIEGEFTATDAGRLWGAIGAVAYAVGWLSTALVVYRRMRAGRMVWWVPLVGATVSFVVLTVCLMVPLFSDPAIMTYLLRTS